MNENENDGWLWNDEEDCMMKGKKVKEERSEINVCFIVELYRASKSYNKAVWNELQKTFLSAPKRFKKIVKAVLA